MHAKASHIDYEKTGFFSRLVTDYLRGGLSSGFYNYTPDIASVANAISSRRQFPCNRQLLVQQLSKDYEGLAISEKTKDNIRKLADENCFTVCTAHQPNVFTGPLYFIYKILHAVRLANELNSQFPDLHFVPVYYMGSEDADLEELGSLHIKDKHLRWQTPQQGAVGRMVVDDLLISLIDEIQQSLTAGANSEEIIILLRRHYVRGISIEKATFGLVNDLLGEFGLVILLPDRESYKRSFVAEFEKEIAEKTSHNILEQTIQAFPSEYKVQASGREINLFMLDGINRLRIEPDGTGIRLAGSGLCMEEAVWKEELHRYPQKFSPNVILRPLFQEKLLPNIAFIGGGAEISYWLELKNVFAAFGIHYPMLVLRNSFLLINEKAAARMRNFELEIASLFKPVHQLETDLVRKRNSLQPDLSVEKQKLNELYDQIREAASLVDRSLSGSAEALRAKALDSLEQIEKKMLKAEKLKHETELRQLNNLLNQLFPAGELQERVDNFIPYYAEYGKGFFHLLLSQSAAFEQKFCSLEIS